MATCKGGASALPHVQHTFFPSTPFCYLRHFSKSHRGGHNRSSLFLSFSLLSSICSHFSPLLLSSLNSPLLLDLSSLFSLLFCPLSSLFTAHSCLFTLASSLTFLLSLSFLFSLLPLVLCLFSLVFPSSVLHILRLANLRCKHHPKTRLPRSARVRFAAPNTSGVCGVIHVSPHARMMHALNQTRTCTHHVSVFLAIITCTNTELHNYVDTPCQRQFAQQWTPSDHTSAR